MCERFRTSSVDKRRRQIVEERERQQRAAREAEEKQRAAANNWENWWAAIDQRIEQWLVAEHNPLTQATGAVLGRIRAQLRDGFKRAIEEAQRSFETKLAALEERLKAVPGKLPVSKIWHQESVTYEGEVVSYDGSLYQARKDTAQSPGGSDWVCIARAGRDGCDGRTPNVCGTYDAYEKYQRLDIVTYDGASFIARRDDPGLCPGDGWQLLASRGKAGDRGQPGPLGERGEPGPPAGGASAAKPPQQLCRGRLIVRIIVPSRRCRMANLKPRSICARSLELITWKLAAREALNPGLGGAPGMDGTRGDCSR